MPFEISGIFKSSLNAKPPIMEDIYSGKAKEESVFKTYQKNKLVRLGLLENKVTDIDGGNFEGIGMPLIKEKTVITDFGVKFMKFFAFETPSEE